MKIPYKGIESRVVNFLPPVLNSLHQIPYKGIERLNLPRTGP